MNARLLSAGLAVLALVAGATGPARAAPDDGVSIKGLRAHLFFERSGTLSKDLIARDPPFSGWNTVIGEGEANEPADNLLVVASLDNPGEEAFLDEKATIRVTGEKNKRLKERVFRGLLLGEHGKLHLPMWIDNAGCLGSITISVTFRKQSLSKSLQLMCGE
jgi:hypothetical protein